MNLYSKFQKYTIRLNAEFETGFDVIPKIDLIDRHYYILSQEDEDNLKNTFIF